MTHSLSNFMTTRFSKKQCIHTKKLLLLHCAPNTSCRSSNSNRRAGRLAGLKRGTITASQVVGNRYIHTYVHTYRPTSPIEIKQRAGQSYVCWRRWSPPCTCVPSPSSCQQPARTPVRTILCSGPPLRTASRGT